MVHLAFVALFAITQSQSQGPAAPGAAGAETHAVRGRDAAADAQLQFDAARFDTLTASTLRAILDSARHQGLPTAPLINRALEGAARRRGGSEIIAVVRQHLAALTNAKVVLGEKSTVAELDAGASALKVGIDANTLSAVRASRSAGEAVTPLVVLTDIVKRGVPTSTAREAVTSIARMPHSDDALLGLQVTVARNSLRGPGMALDALNRYVRGTLSGTMSPPAPATIDRKQARPPFP